MSATLIQVLDDLDMTMVGNFGDYASILMDAWSGFSGNEGQMAIVENHILPTVEEHIANARDLWPRGAGPEQYLEAVMGCYDPEVIQRAFGDTLYGTYQELWGPHTEAEDHQQEHDHVAMIMSEGGNPPEPHSMEWFGKFSPV